MQRSPFAYLRSGILSVALLACAAAPAFADSSALSGTMQYSLEPAQIKSALGKLGIASVKQPYAGTSMFLTAGMRVISITKPGEYGGMTVMVMAVENQAAVIQKAKAVAKERAAETGAAKAPAASAGPLSSLQNLQKMCKPQGKSYVQTAGSVVPVNVLTCTLPGRAPMRVEMTTLFEQKHPLIVYAINQTGKLDETLFSDIVQQADNS